MMLVVVGMSARADALSPELRYALNQQAVALVCVARIAEALACFAACFDGLGRLLR